MRPIDADKIDYLMVERNGMELYMVWKGQILNMPTIDPVKHGRWVCGCCSQCGYILHSTGLTNYCPNCGAKMEE